MSFDRTDSPGPDASGALDQNAETFEPGSEASAAVGPDALETTLSDRARELGFFRLGLASAEPFPEDQARFEQWVAAGRDANMSYLRELSERGNPQRLLPGARSLVVVAAAIAAPREHRLPLVGEIASYARGQDYHIALRGRLRHVGQALADATGRSFRGRPCLDTAPLFERAAAVRAGLGFIGKSSMLIVPGVGPRVLLATLITDLELPRSAPGQGHCGRCTLCLTACPTAAFVAPNQLDSARCISYWTIEQRGAIPRELRALIGTRIFGCDDCVTSCPYDRPDSAPVMPTDFAPRRALELPALLAWAKMSSTDYRRLAKQSALRRVGRTQLIRNAVLALGNCGSLEAVPVLAELLATHPQSLIRGHAAWALGQLPVEASGPLLRAAAQSEQDAEVLGELNAALQAQSAP